MPDAPERMYQSDSGRSVPALQVEVHTDGQRPPELRLRGEIDIVTVPILHESLSALVDGNGGDGDVVVDLSAVEFISAAGMETLCSQARNLRQRGRRLVLSSPSALTLRVIDILRMAEHLSVAGPSGSAPGGPQAGGDTAALNGN